MSDEFTDAVWLLASYTDKTDDDLPEVFRALRETCPTIFDKILLLAHVIKHHRTRFDAAGLADTSAILRDFIVTAGNSKSEEESQEIMESDAQHFLALMEEAAAKVEMEHFSRLVAELTQDRLHEFVDQCGPEARLPELIEFYNRVLAETQ